MLKKMGQAIDDCQSFVNKLNPYQKGISTAEKADRHERMMYVAGAIGIISFGMSLAFMFGPHGSLKEFLVNAISGAGLIGIGVHQGISALKIRMSEEEDIALSNLVASVDVTRNGESLKDRDIEQI